MRIDFEIDGKPVTYHRDGFTGQSELRTAQGAITLDSATDVGTHFNLNTRTERTADVYGRRVMVEKVRPLLFGGLRPARYRIFVDGELAAESSGY